jgi:hypothetical protein
MATRKAKSHITFNDKNQKLGRGVYSLSIDRDSSCLGKSEVCQKICYGGCNRPSWTSQQLALKAKYLHSLSASFKDDVIAALRKGEPPKAVRIHDVGDFYSACYIRKWTKIARTCPEVKFFAYTRAWTNHALAYDLWWLSLEPNVTLFLSLDKSMDHRRIPRILADLPRAWLATDDDDIPPKDSSVTLVFRNLRNKLTKLKDPNHFGATVCKAETGDKKTTCSACGFCWET